MTYKPTRRHSGPCLEGMEVKRCAEDSRKHIVRANQSAP